MIKGTANVSKSQSRNWVATTHPNIKDLVICTVNKVESEAFRNIGTFSSLTVVDVGSLAWNSFTNCTGIRKLSLPIDVDSVNSQTQ